MKISEALLIILFMGLATLIYFHDYLYLPNIKLTTYCMQYACYDCANFQVQNEGLTSKTKFLANKDIHLSVFYDGYTPLEELKKKKMIYTFSCIKIVATGDLYFDVRKWDYVMNVKKYTLHEPKKNRK